MLMTGNPVILPFDAALWTMIRGEYCYLSASKMSAVKQGERLDAVVRKTRLRAFRLLP